MMIHTLTKAERLVLEEMYRLEAGCSLNAWMIRMAN